MRWHSIEDEQALDKVIASSYQAPVLIFKHSYRCAISATAFSRLERSWKLEEEKIIPYLVDVIAQRPLSQFIAKKTGIRHESPQAIVLKDGKAVYDDSHLAISYEEIEVAIKSGK